MVDAPWLHSCAGGHRSDDRLRRAVGARPGERVYQQGRHQPGHGRTSPLPRAEPSRCRWLLLSQDDAVVRDWHRGPGALPLLRQTPAPGSDDRSALKQQPAATGPRVAKESSGRAARHDSFGGGVGIAMLAVRPQSLPLQAFPQPRRRGSPGTRVRAKARPVRRSASLTDNRRRSGLEIGD